MAKKKTNETADSRHIVISLKGTEAFRDWVNELADHERITSVAVIERALVEYAANHGFKKPAPKRTR